jgi:DNA-binding transcriptional ArsR family regulator
VDAHPVIAAIDAERERLVEARQSAEQEVAQCERELDALDAAAESVSASLNGNAPVPEPSPELAPPPAPASNGRGSPGPGTDRAQQQKAHDDAVFKVIADAGEPLAPMVVAEETGLTATQVNHTAKRLEDAGHIVREGEGRWTRYRTGQVAPVRALIAETAEAIYAFIAAQGGTVRTGEIARKFKLTSDEARSRLAILLADGRIEKTGLRAGTRYGITGHAQGEEVASPPLPTDDEREIGTLQGRILATLALGPLKPQEIATKLLADYDEVMQALGSLYVDGEVRTVKSGGELAYRAV